MVMLATIVEEDHLDIEPRYRAITGHICMKMQNKFRGGAKNFNVMARRYMHLGLCLIHRQIFGIPAQLVSDNGKQFEGENITMLLNAFKIQSGKSTPLYPQSNGQVEATNKTIADNLKKN
ncbi:uncharacterized protein LOC113280576 [Papaver somniferum]|uniref:uncharacterized protein LOC113280576 n=1 Tax=Papaver somniferum TaxID=3469 RepID=UPI000E6FCBF7|nr:uncharacterized protein LOC113280576 [Papaver somniferum]